MEIERNAPLLVVEDSDEDFVTLQRLMQRMEVTNPIYRCADGDEALDFFYPDSAVDTLPQLSIPSVILLDLNLPGTDGRDVLKRLKQDSSYKEIPVVVFTTSANPEDVEFCYQGGANGYLIKPMHTGDLQRTMQAFVDYWLKVNTPPLCNP
jgi:CheY-like chemotaxis protein